MDSVAEKQQKEKPQAGQRDRTQAIVEALELLTEPGQVIELRIPNAQGRNNRTDAGYFDDAKALAKKAAALGQGQSPGVYITLNPVNPALLARSANRVGEYAKNLTQDPDILYRRWLPIDADPVRPSGISATEEEHTAALERATKIRVWLTSRGWPSPLMADSGNGAHLIYRLPNLPNTPENTTLIQRCIEALAMVWDDETVTIDKAVFNASRIWKLYGTLAAKGDHTEDRPHRWAHILETPDTIAPVTEEQLQALAATLPEPVATPTTNRNGYRGTATPLDLEEWIRAHNLDVGTPKDWNGAQGRGRRWIFNVCPWNPAHTDKSAYLIQFTNGAISAGCKHNGCSGHDWQSLRVKFDGTKEERYQRQAPRAYRNGTGPAHSSNGTGPHTEEETPARSSPALETITGLIETTGQNTDLEQIEKQRAIREGLALAIGEISRATHREVISALVDAGIYTKTEAGAFVRDCVADAKRRREEEKQARTEAQKQAAASSPLPTIEVNDRQLSELEEEAVAAIVTTNSLDPARPVLYVRGGTLTRVTADEHGNHSTQVITEAACKAILAKCADWIRTSTDNEGTEKTTNTFPPSDVARAVVNRGEWTEIPTLEGIVNVPVFGKGGKLHTEPGYNPHTRLYYTGGVTLGDTTPTEDNVAQARSLLLDDLFVDFPFRDDASRAHAVALFLAPYVRPMIPDATPLHLIDAPAPGTGKGLLGDVCAIPALGRELPSTTAGKDDDEWRKRITAALLEGGNFVSIDNITQPLDSGVLASVLTQSYWQDRILGASLNVNLRVRTIWIANGNNVVPSDEIARRAVWIRIDANQEKPWDRQEFKHPKLKTWAKENRNQLVTAAITLIRAWIDEGMKPYTGKSKGSYDTWANVLGGILETVGIGGFLANESELFEATVNENSVLTEFVKAWKDAYEFKTVTVSGDLFPLASYPDDAKENQGQYKNLLEELLGAGNESSRKKRLGILLQRNRDKVIAGAKIVKESRGNGGARYRLKDVTAPQQGGLVENVKKWVL